MTDWTRDVPALSFGHVSLSVVGPAPITEIDVDLVGDGAPAPVQLRGLDLESVASVRFVPPRRPGAFELQVRARDAAGCEAATGLRRDVVVR